jgi:hypothetical protein
MTLKEAEGRKVKVTFTDGETMSGLVVCYTSALDNEPEPASITIGNTELYENEMQSIELI